MFRLRSITKTTRSPVTGTPKKVGASTGFSSTAAGSVPAATAAHLTRAVSERLPGDRLEGGDHLRAGPALLGLQALDERLRRAVVAQRTERARGSDPHLPGLVRERQDERRRRGGASRLPEREGGLRRERRGPRPEDGQEGRVDVGAGDPDERARGQEPLGGLALLERGHDRLPGARGAQARERVDPAGHDRGMGLERQRLEHQRRGRRPVEVEERRVGAPPVLPVGRVRVLLEVLLRRVEVGLAGRVPTTASSVQTARARVRVSRRDIPGAYREEAPASDEGRDGPRRGHPGRDARGIARRRGGQVDLALVLDRRNS